MPDITVVFNPPNKADGRAQFEADCMDMGDKLNRSSPRPTRLRLA